MWPGKRAPACEDHVDEAEHGRAAVLDLHDLGGDVLGADGPASRTRRAAAARNVALGEHVAETALTGAFVAGAWKVTKWRAWRQT